MVQIESCSFTARFCSIEISVTISSRQERCNSISSCVLECNPAFLVTVCNVQDQIRVTYTPLPPLCNSRCQLTDAGTQMKTIESSKSPACVQPEGLGIHHNSACANICVYIWQASCCYARPSKSINVNSHSSHHLPHGTFLVVKLCDRGHKPPTLPCRCLQPNVGAPPTPVELSITRNPCQPRILLCRWSLCRRWGWKRATHFRGSDVCREAEPCCGMSQGISPGLHSRASSNFNGKSRSKPSTILRLEADRS
jgi:hypothetical protein